MRALRRSPSWLVKQPYCYCFNIQVPQDLQEAVGLRTLRYSLNTNDIKPARRLSARMGAYTWEVFGAIRRDIKEQGQPRMSATEIRTLIKNYLDNLLRCDESIRMQAPGKALIDLYRALLADIQSQAEEATIPGAEAEIHASDEDHERLRAQGLDDDQIKRLLSPATYPAWMDWDDIARKLLEAQGCKPFREMDSAETTALTQELSEAQKQFGTIAEMRWAGNKVDAAKAYSAYLDMLKNDSPMLTGLNFPVVDAQKQKEATAPRGPMQLRGALEALLAQTVTTTDQQAFWAAVEASQRGRLSAGIASNVVETQTQPEKPARNITKPLGRPRKDAQKPAQQEPEAPQGKLLSELIEAFMAHKRGKGDWSLESERKYLPRLTMLIELMGDIPANTITFQIMEEYRDKLRKWPKNKATRTAYRDLSTAEALALDLPPNECLSVTSVNRYVDDARQMFTFAVQRDFMQKNCAEGLRISGRGGKRADEMVDPFTLEELGSIFRYRDFLEDKASKPHRFWAPILLTFTGARANEICQLDVADVRLSDGVWIVDINDSDGGNPQKHLKTAQSRRIIPLHDFLIHELNFIGFVEKQKASGAVRLFPELTYYKENNTYAKYLSSWFNGMVLKKVGLKVIPDRVLVLHSLRHTFTTQLLNGSEAEMRFTKMVLGHSLGTGQTESTYLGRAKASQLKVEVIDKLDYDKKIDLSHLKRSKWVVPAEE